MPGLQLAFSSLARKPGFQQPPVCSRANRTAHTVQPAQTKQTKPDLSRPGELYYEGKEFEVQIHDKRPGMLSDALKAALGMPDGSPPPWLINMQRYGPPPSYPYLKVQGLNAPIPEGAQFGYHPGG